MKLLYVADGRSATALNWIEYFIRGGHEVHLVSTFPCEAAEGLASLTVIPVALSGLYAQLDRGGRPGGNLLRRILPVNLRTLIRQLSAPLSFTKATGTLRGVIERIQPELVHAMRIPYEGMITAEAINQITSNNINHRNIPLLISVWGNDFTLHAKATPAMSAHTRQALKAADGLHTDCQRDQRLAVELGFDAKKPNIVLPGGGGVKMDVFYPADGEHEGALDQLRASGRPVTIINPRGFRAYVRNDTFFKAIPLVVDKYPEVRFLCPGMSDEAQANKWIAEFNISEKVELLPAQSRRQMAELFRQAQISLSITTHDGTPNTLLEAMACGCFPIAGDIESLHEWIITGENGLLVDPGDPKALAAAIVAVIEQPELRRRARERNIQLVKERGEYGKCMGMAEEFYGKVISRELN